MVEISTYNTEYSIQYSIPIHPYTLIQPSNITGSKACILHLACACASRIARKHAQQSTINNLAPGARRQAPARQLKRQQSATWRLASGPSPSPSGLAASGKEQGTPHLTSQLVGSMGARIGSTVL
eukprot:scaffold251124_cov32-Tisochrysis_lutea.AAC.1